MLLNFPERLNKRCPVDMKEDFAGSNSEQVNQLRFLSRRMGTCWYGLALSPKALDQFVCRR